MNSITCPGEFENTCPFFVVSALTDVANIVNPLMSVIAIRRNVICFAGCVFLGFGALRKRVQELSILC